MCISIWNDFSEVSRPICITLDTVMRYYWGLIYMDKFLFQWIFHTNTWVSLLMLILQMILTSNERWKVFIVKVIFWLENLENILRKWGCTSFTFRNYLSVLSTIHFLKPYTITFAYENLPFVDETKYSDWFEEINGNIPFGYNFNCHILTRFVRTQSGIKLLFDQISHMREQYNVLLVMQHFLLNHWMPGCLSPV